MRIFGIYHPYYWLVVPLFILTLYLYIYYPPEFSQQREQRLCEEAGGIYLRAYGGGGLLGGGGVAVDCVFPPIKN